MIEKSFPVKDPDALKIYLEWGHRNRFKLHELNVLAANKIVKPEKPFQLSKLDSFWKEISAYQLAEGEAILDMGAGNGFLSFILSLSGLPLDIYASEIDPDFRQSIVDKNASLSSIANRNNITTVVARENDLGLDSVLLDKIIMKEVFHHLEFPEQILFAVKKNLKKDGTLILVEGTRDLPAPKGSRCPKSTTKKKIVNALEKAGFRLTEELIIGEDYLLKFRA